MIERNLPDLESEFLLIFSLIFLDTYLVIPYITTQNKAKNAGNNNCKFLGTKPIISNTLIKPKITSK